MAPLWRGWTLPFPHGAPLAHAGRVAAPGPGQAVRSEQDRRLLAARAAHELGILHEVERRDQGLATEVVFEPAVAAHDLQEFRERALVVAREQQPRAEL